MYRPNSSQKSSYQNGPPEVRPSFWRMKHRSLRVATCIPPFFMELGSPWFCGHDLRSLRSHPSTWRRILMTKWFVTFLYICLGKPLPKLTFPQRVHFWLARKRLGEMCVCFCWKHSQQNQPTVSTMAPVPGPYPGPWECHLLWWRFHCPWLGLPHVSLWTWGCHLCEYCWEWTAHVIWKHGPHCGTHGRIFGSQVGWVCMAGGVFET